MVRVIVVVDLTLQISIQHYLTVLNRMTMTLFFYSGKNCKTPVLYGRNASILIIFMFL